MDVNELRKLFPILSIKSAGRDIVYLDNAATSQRPVQVSDKILEINNFCNANIHRAVHSLASAATGQYEAARKAVAEFIGAGAEREIVFTSGTTASVNLVAFCFGEKFVGNGDEIIVPEAEHHSNLVPWQMLCERKGAILRVLKVLDNGELDLDGLERLISDRTRLIAAAHVSNVLGIVNPVGEIIRIAHSRGVPVLIDGAQGIVHEKVDVQALDCDFYAFSGHKMFASTGTGVLYGKKRWLDSLPPFMGGGEMIGSVSFSGTTYADAPYKFEAGTQNISGVPTFVPAISMTKLCREDASLSQNLVNIRDFVLETLLQDDRIRLFGVPRETSAKIPLFSFAVNGAHHEDLALILDKMGIAVRSGQMCAEPLMDRFGVTGMLRASFAAYNTMEEAEYFIKSLDRAIKMLI
ncbi:MAG: SufS family cysteine desulfurase [Bacteroidales bacterium]|nr:SufS family cysteine desulfurase [Bacteroidales bacterium]